LLGDMLKIQDNFIVHCVLLLPKLGKVWGCAPCASLTRSNQAY
jgi:hypothetical protein